MKPKTENQERKEKEIKSWVLDAIEKIKKLLLRQRKKRDRERKYMDPAWARGGRMSWEMERTQIYPRYSA